MKVIKDMKKITITRPSWKMHMEGYTWNSASNN